MFTCLVTTKSSKVVRRDHFREVTLQGSNIQRGDRLVFTLFSPKSYAPPPPPPPAINNDQSLRLYQDGGNVLN